MDPAFGCDFSDDILTWNPLTELPDGWVGAEDFIYLASPPCESMTVLRIGANWTGPKDDPPHQPKTDAARLGLAILQRTRDLVDIMKPRWFVFENPRAKARVLPPFADLRRTTESYCSWGESFMKPTDLWGGFPPSWVSRGVCDTRTTGTTEVDGVEWRVDREGNPCHVSAPRGSTSGIQGGEVIERKFRGGVVEDMAKHHSKSLERGQMAAERAKIPYELSLSVCLAAEADLGGEPVPVIVRPSSELTLF
jgi:hypothetical protein